VLILVNALRRYVSLKYPRSSVWQVVWIKRTSGIPRGVKSVDISNVRVKCSSGTGPKVPSYSRVGNIMGKTVYQGGPW